MHWPLILANPARILGLTNRGRLKPGLRADVTIINKNTRRVEATLVAGEISYLVGAAGNRFLA